MRTPGWILTVALVLTGCPSGGLTDFDGDGEPDATDCDPSDPSIYAGAPDAWGNEIDENCDGGDGIDRDGDGAPGNPELADQPEHDCDDQDPAVNPSATEVANGIDDDCDGAIDEDTPGADDDGDGFCEGVDRDADGSLECTDGALPGDCDDDDASLNGSDWDADGSTTCGGDCDDFAPLVSPLLSEACDGADTDCDGELLVDEGDADADGALGCAGDCDDDDPDVEPGNVEICNGKDDDCDPQTPEDVDLDGDGFTLCDGDCDDTEAAMLPGATEACDGLDNDCDGPADEACTDCDASVPDDYGSIQAAIDGVADDALICVEPGTYFELLDFGGRGIAVVSLAGPATTTLDGAGSGPVVSFVSGEPTNALLSGFTITNGDAATGGGVLVSNASFPVLEDLVVTANHVTGSGGGIAIDGGSVGTLVDVSIEGNISDGAGGGLVCVASMASLQDVVIEGNLAAGVGGGGYLSGCPLDAQGLSVIGNTSGNDGGGMRATGAAVTLSDATFVGNGSALDGGGLYLLWGASGTIEQSLFDGNTSSVSGGGYYVSGGNLAVKESSLTLSHSLVVNGSATLGGGLSASGASLEFDHVLVAGNNAPNGGGLHLAGTPAVLSHSAFVGNGASRGGGIRGGAHIKLITSSLTASSSDFSHGTLGAAIVLDIGESWGGVSLASCNLWDNVGGGLVQYLGSPPAVVGVDGNLAADPGYQMALPDPMTWDLHLDPTSPLVDAGNPAVSDPDGGPADIGIYGGPGAGDWDLDGDGAPLWWHPGAYDSSTDPSAGWDCDDSDPSVAPGSGC